MTEEAVGLNMHNHLDAYCSLSSYGWYFLGRETWYLPDIKLRAAIIDVNKSTRATTGNTAADVEPPSTQSSPATGTVVVHSLRNNASCSHQGRLSASVRACRNHMLKQKSTSRAENSQTFKGNKRNKRPAPCPQMAAPGNCVPGVRPTLICGRGRALAQNHESHSIRGGLARRWMCDRSVLGPSPPLNPHRDANLLPHPLR